MNTPSIVISSGQLVMLGVKHYGYNRDRWRFQCPGCGRIQSGRSVREQMNQGIPSKRFGTLVPGMSLLAHTFCYSPDCDFAAQDDGTEFLVVHRHGKPYKAGDRKNCYFILPVVGADGTPAIPSRQLNDGKRTATKTPSVPTEQSPELKTPDLEGVRK